MTRFLAPLFLAALIPSLAQADRPCLRNLDCLEGEFCARPSFLAAADHDRDGRCCPTSGVCQDVDGDGSVCPSVSLDEPGECMPREDLDGICMLCSCHYDDPCTGEFVRPPECGLRLF